MHRQGRARTLRRSPGRLARFLHRAPIGLYRCGLGWLIGSRFLLLTHTGRNSGLARHTVLEVMRYDPMRNRYIVAAGFGARSDWFRNILTRPDVTVQVGRRSLPGRARCLNPDEALCEVSDYVRQHPLAARLVASVLGFALDAREETRRAFVAQVPLVEFTCSPAVE